jgi:hypothetical protein
MTTYLQLFSRSRFVKPDISVQGTSYEGRSANRLITLCCPPRYKQENLLILWCSKLMTPCSLVGVHQHCAHTVTCMLIGRRRLGKHIPGRVNAHKNRTPIARQRINTHTSLTIEAVFLVESMQNGYKEVFGSIQQSSLGESSFEMPARQDTSLRAGSSLWWQERNYDVKRRLHV